MLQTSRQEDTLMVETSSLSLLHLLFHCIHPLNCGWSIDINVTLDFLFLALRHVSMTEGFLGLTWSEIASLDGNSGCIHGSLDYLYAHARAYILALRPRRLLPLDFHGFVVILL